MRTLDDITDAVRRNEPVELDELRYAVVAYDVLMAQLEVEKNAVQLRAYFQAATLDPRIYIGPLNDPEVAATREWYDAMKRVSDPPLIEPHDWGEDGERCVVCGAKDWMPGGCSGPTGD